MQVTFRKVKDVEIVEIELLNGTVAAFPAGDKDPESGKPWRERFGNEYGAFKKAIEPKKPEPKPEAKLTGLDASTGFGSHVAPEPAFIPPPAEHKDII